MKKMMVLSILVVTMNASVLDEGVRALKHGQYKIAMEEFLILAKQGNIIAQQNLGVMYNTGLGVKKDSMRAAYWFNVADGVQYSDDMQYHCACAQR